jgi:regulator of nonsense transcripts 1
MSLKKKRLAYFIFTSRDEFDSNLMPGNELKLSLKSHNWSATGHVIKINSNDEVCLELHGGTPPPHNLTLGYTVEFVWKSTSFGRMKVGLKKFYKD